MERYLEHIVRSAEKRVEHFLNKQVKVPGRPDYGSLECEMVEVKPTIYVLASAVAVYCHPASKFHRDKRLLDAMELAMDFVGRNQRADGALDYPSCNFHSAADTSFCFKRLIAAYRVLDRFGGAETKQLREKYLSVMKKALNMIRTGGFHTPNHRWGITAALMQGAGLFAGEPELAGCLKMRAQQYLAEGIDGSPEGEYAERSTGNYNAVVNNAMMALYEETGDENYLGYAARNLHMMLTYIDPDDTIFTQNSTRQDQGKSDYMDKYFYQYLYLAARTLNPDSPYAVFHEEFDAAAHKIIKDNKERGDLAPECLHIIMAHEVMEQYRFRGYGFLDEYRKFYQDAGVLRVKTPAYGYSILRGKSAFLFLKVKETPVYVKIGESIGSSRNFIPETMELRNGECILTSRLCASYYEPFDQAPETSDWWKMDHSRRRILINSELKTVVSVREQEDGLELDVHTEGLDRVPVRIQVCIPSGSALDHEAFSLTAERGESMILKSGTVRICHKDQVLEAGPGIGEHAFNGHYNGEEWNDSGYTVLMNAYTPFDHTFQLKIR